MGVLGSEYIIGDSSGGLFNREMDELVILIFSFLTFILWTDYPTLERQGIFKFEGSEELAAHNLGSIDT